MIPDYSINVGDMHIDTSEPEEIQEISVKLSLDTPADSCHLSLGPSPKFAKVKLLDSVSIKLGYDSTTTVFTGIVDSLHSETRSVKIQGLSQMLKLLKQRLSQAYQNQNAGDIVKDICNKAGVPLGPVHDGISLPSLFVSQDVPSYEYLKELAERSGFDLYINADGELVFKEFESNKTHDLEYANQIIRIETSQYHPPEGVKVYGESPSSSMGSDTSHWLSKDKMEGSAGDRDGPIVYDAAVRDKDTADAVAKARLAQARHTHWVSILALGTPEVKLGDTVVLKGFDQDLLKGEFKVRSIDHHLSKRRGFTTRLRCSKEA
jgi:phage protein D